MVGVFLDYGRSFSEYRIGVDILTGAHPNNPSPQNVIRGRKVMVLL